MMHRIGTDEYLKHAKSHPWLGEPTRRYEEHPICPRCEKIALRGNGRKGSWEKDRIACCPSCGWYGRTTTLLRGYLNDQMYRS